MLRVATTAVDEATALEAEAGEYPDERGEILIEAALAWRRAGHPERAEAVLTRLVEAGGEDACYALNRAAGRSDDRRGRAGRGDRTRR